MRTRGAAASPERELPASARRPAIYSARSAAVEGDRATAWGMVRGGSRRAAGAQALSARRSSPGGRVRRAGRPGVAVRRSRGRDVAVCTLQMWAYLAAYKTPHDDPQAQERRVHIDYPIVADRVLGLGELPTVRLQRALARRSAQDGSRVAALDRVLVWAHWAWFHRAPRHARLHPRAPSARFPRAAVLTYAVFDIGASFYWLMPTAPPWYAAAQRAARRRRTARDGGGRAADDGRVRRAFLGRQLGSALQCASEAIPWPRCPRCTSPHP